MGVMTIRAPDSATALELVQRRLGDDALIMSTVTRDGQVEIVAATAPEPMDEPEQQYNARKTNVTALPGFLKSKGINDFAAVLQKAKTGQPVAEEQPVEIERPAKAAKPAIDITLDEAITPEYAPEPSVASVEPAPEAAMVADSTDLPDPVGLRDGILSAQRVVLVGPSGAGKCMAALQLSAMQRIRQPELKVEFVYCGNGSFADGAFLAQKSHLLGMNTVFANPGEIPTPAKGHLQIVVISGRSGPAPEQVRMLLDMPGTKGALVLPAGLRPARLEKMAARWAELASGVVLGVEPDAPAEEQDSEDIAGIGLTHLWTSVSDRVLDGLSVPDSEEIEAVSDTAAPHVFFRHRLTPPVEEASK